MRHPGSALRSDDFKGESDQLDDEFKETLTELIPFIANDDTAKDSHMFERMLNVILSGWYDKVKTNKIHLL